MSLHSGFGLNGYYDDRGMWQRTKFCFVYCGQRCDCGPPGGLHYSSAHDKRLTQQNQGEDAQNSREDPDPLCPKVP